MKIFSESVIIQRAFNNYALCLFIHEGCSRRIKIYLMHRKRLEKVGLINAGTYTSSFNFFLQLNQCVLVQSMRATARMLNNFLSAHPRREQTYNKRHRYILMSTLEIMNSPRDRIKTNYARKN